MEEKSFNNHRNQSTARHVFLYSIKEGRGQRERERERERGIERSGESESHKFLYCFSVRSFFHEKNFEGKFKKEGRGAEKKV